jgi:deoxycytidylate deaminase
MSAERFLCEAIELARNNVRRGGRPFGAVLVKDGKVISTGVNEIGATGDPTRMPNCRRSVRQARRLVRRVLMAA